MLSGGTPILCGLGSESRLFIRVWKVWSSRKCFMKMGSLPCRLRSLGILYGHDGSQTFFFFRSKDCNMMLFASLIGISI